MIKAILFDMDGVLIDAKDWHYEALNKSLHHFGYKISRESHLSTFDGLPTIEKLSILSKTKQLPVKLHDLINTLKQKYTLQMAHLHCNPKFNHQFALSMLKNQNYKIGLCSNSVKKSIMTMITLASLDSYFDCIISNEDVANSKPHPEMYCKAMKTLSVEAKECLIVEDNINGIRAAYASGAYVLEVNGPNEVTYDRIINRLREVNED